MRVLIALPGLHKVNRGAEITLMSIANELASMGDDITLMGSGPPLPNTLYRFIHVPSISRTKFQRFPIFPPFRSDTIYEDFTFSLSLLRHYRPRQYDATVSCSFPFTNWMLTRPFMGHSRPPHVFVTQNGDWPANAVNSEYRFFRCEGLICTNPDYYERNRTKWNSILIPNGVDTARFSPPQHSPFRSFNLPLGVPIVLMVSALVSSKRVRVGIDALAELPEAHLVVAGDGPERDSILHYARQRLEDRFTLLNLNSDAMPDLYRSADVFLHLSFDESFGNVYLEAMATGLPIVGHETPRLRWIVGEKENLVDTRNKSALVRSIDKALVQSKKDRSERVERARQFNWKNIALSYRAFLQSLVIKED